MPMWPLSTKQCLLSTQRSCLSCAAQLQTTTPDTPIHPSCSTEKETVMRSQPASLLAQHEVQHLLLGAARVGEQLLQGGQALLGGGDARQPVSGGAGQGKVWVTVGMKTNGCLVVWKRMQRQSPAKQIQNNPASFTQLSEPKLTSILQMLAQSRPRIPTHPRSAACCADPVSCRQAPAPFPSAQMRDLCTAAR